MELREWQYINKSAGSTTSSASSSYKKRFEKLIKYHIDHASSELESVTRKDISDRYFRLSEHYNDGSKEFDRGIIVYVDKGTEEFEIHIFIDHEEVASIQRKGYENFVAAIEPYMFLPDAGTQEYDDLLVEWVAMKNSNTSSQSVSSTSSTSYKKRLEKLIDFHIAHKGPYVMNYKKDITDFALQYTEERRGGYSSYSFELSIGINKDGDWNFSVYVDGTQKGRKSGNGWDALVWQLGDHLNLPNNKNNPMYQDLLTEALKEWKAMSPPKASQPASKSKSQEERYKKLIAQIDTDGIAKYKVNELTDTVLDFNVSTKYKPAGYRVKIEYNSATDDFNLQVADGTTLKGNNWNEDILTLFGAGAILRETDLLRESHSLADDFRLYENLWD